MKILASRSSTKSSGTSMQKVAWKLCERLSPYIADTSCDNGVFTITFNHGMQGWNEATATLRKDKQDYIFTFPEFGIEEHSIDYDNIDAFVDAIVWFWD